MSMLDGSRIYSKVIGEMKIYYNPYRFDSIIATALLVSLRNANCEVIINDKSEYWIGVEPNNKEQYVKLIDTNNLVNSVIVLFGLDHFEPIVAISDNLERIFDTDTPQLRNAWLDNTIRNSLSVIDANAEFKIYDYNMRSNGDTYFLDQAKEKINNLMRVSLKDKDTKIHYWYADMYLLPYIAHLKTNRWTSMSPPFYLYDKSKRLLLSNTKITVLKRFLYEIADIGYDDIYVLSPQKEAAWKYNPECIVPANYIKPMNPIQE